MKVRTRNRERGVALFVSIFALMLLMAIGAAMIFMSTTETSINSNYRQEEMAYFAAKAGAEEARARMMASDPGSIACASALPAGAPCPSPVTGNTSYPLFDPAQITQASMSPLSNYMIYYIVNPGSGTSQPWKSTDPYADDELCHDGYTGLGLTVVAPDIRCAPVDLPATAYVSYTSTLPFAGGSSALPYKWVRIAPKLNSSIGYLTGTGSTASVSHYTANTNSTETVNGGTQTVNINGTTPMCWDGQEEVALTTTTTAPFVSDCSKMTNAAGAAMTNVYLVTALGVSSNRASAARKVVQSEVALQPTAPFPYGLFATSTACPAISFSGNNASTDSYTTAGGGTYGGANNTTVNWGGDVGSNGGVSVQNGNVGGIVGVLQGPPNGAGPCATPDSVNQPNGSSLGPNCTTAGSGCVSCPGPTGPLCMANTPTYVPVPYTFPVPPAPNPLPPITNYTPPNCSGGKKSGLCMVAGSYGNISLTGTLNMAPGVYNINSLSMTGNAQIIVNPPGPLTFNVAGCANATCSSTLGNPLAIAGNGITDDTKPNDFTINYAGAGTITIAGNGGVTAILNAPNATITQQGNGNWYGSILGSTISIGGNAFFHFDRAAALAPNNNGYFTMISYREVPY